MPRNGWIQDPQSRDTKHFHADEHSGRQGPRVFVDSGRSLPGHPPLLKTRVYLPWATAQLLWRELLRVGWHTCEPQWAADADV